MSMGRRVIPLQKKAKECLLGTAIPILLLGLLSCSKKTSLSIQQESDTGIIDRMVAVEELILELTPQLELLSGNVLNLKLPTSETRAALFSKNIEVAGTALSPQKPESHHHLELIRWQPEGKDATDLWGNLLGKIAYFEHARFYFTDGGFNRQDQNRFDALVGFEAAAVDQQGNAAAIKTTQKISWCLEEGSWRICAWQQQPLTMKHAPRPLFREILEQAIPDSRSYQEARRSRHEQNIIALFTKDKFTVTKQLHADYLDLDSTFQHPGLSVVDYDNDGWDDLYVMGRWGANQMLRNSQDGTFTDVAREIGLDINGLCNCAIFADFDNDGDADAFIGRSLERSIYLVNENGRYTDRTREACGNMPLPFLVSTISAVDYNQDGLLDVYLGLYAPPQKSGTPDKWARQFFPEKMAQEILDRFPGSHRYINRLGPPNLLLANRGDGRFSVAAETGELAEWHNTYQSVWSDFDGDGDPDVYVCNDFAPDHLYRNDGPGSGEGKPRFVDVSAELAGSAMQGFGMGASWGDFDRDGRLDLYVSNMFSKAGRRITGSIEGLDPRLPHSARGNLLFQNTGTTFRQLAGTGSENLQVAKAGWAYGAQFVDVDNDGWLDIYSASGFYTAPDEIANNRDL